MTYKKIDIKEFKKYLEWANAEFHINDFKEGDGYYTLNDVYIRMGKLTSLFKNCENYFPQSIRTDNEMLLLAFLDTCLPNGKRYSDYLNRNKNRRLQEVKLSTEGILSIRSVSSDAITYEWLYDELVNKRKWDKGCILDENKEIFEKPRGMMYIIFDRNSRIIVIKFYNGGGMGSCTTKTQCKELLDKYFPVKQDRQEEEARPIREFDNFSVKQDNAQLGTKANLHSLGAFTPNITINDESTMEKSALEELYENEFNAKNKIIKIMDELQNIINKYDERNKW